MPHYRLRRFCHPHTLRAIAPDRLRTFLEPFREALGTLGANLPDPSALEPIDYDKLVRVFVSPDAALPKALLDALYFVDEMATPHGMDALLAAAERKGISLSLPHDASAADVAVQAWLADRDLLEREHAELFLVRPRTFDYFQTDSPNPPKTIAPTPQTLADLERDLGQWFAGRKRGQGTRVFSYPRDGEIVFLVRHGEPFRREESLEGNEPSSVCFRPLKYDVVAYQPNIGELRINARSPAEKEQYRRLFGRHFFSDANFFPGDSKYSLDPLRDRGEESLVCVDVEGIEWVKLREVHIFWGGPSNAVEIHKADDVFEALRARLLCLPQSARLIRATFQVKFADARRPRSVSLRPSNIAQYTRDDDSELVDEWLSRRGFIVAAGGAKKDASHAALASA